MGDVMKYMLMPLRRYADFSGRSRRMEFWMWKLFTFLIGIVVWILIMSMIGGAAFANDPQALAAAGGGAMIVIMLYGLFALATLIPDLAVTVRRLHDTDRSGWWILAPLLPYIVALVSALGGAASGDQNGLAAGGLIAGIAMLAALVLGIVLLVFMFLEGTRGPNRFGPDPKGATDDEHMRTFA
jgi:uncharacterized membrane protein YhaH (DUF805 family)